MSDMQLQTKTYGFLFFFAVLIVISLLMVFVVGKLEESLNGVGSIFGIIAMFLLLIYMMSAFAYSLKNSEDKSAEYAFGLPKGTVRAVLALGVLMVFVGLSVFLFDALGSGAIVSKEKPQVLSENLLTYQDNKNNWHTFSNKALETRNNLVTQIFTSISTLLATIVAFYFGARVAQSTKKNDPNPSPTP